MSLFTFTMSKKISRLIQNKANGVWYYQQSVPKTYQSVEPRKLVKFSLKTDSLNEAERLRDIKDRELIDLWEGRLRGDLSNQDAQERYREIVRLARLHGFEYRTERSLAEKAPLQELLGRVAKIAELESKSAPNVEQLAVIGGVSPPNVT